MANYDFGQQILRSIEIQDQLKQRNDELKMQQMHWNAQLGMQQRQMELEQARLNEMANYHGAQLNLNQDKFMQTAREIFLKSHTPAESLPSDIRSKLSPKDAVVSPFNNKPYYLTSTVTDTEQSLTRAETAKRDAQMAKHQGILESQGAQRLRIEKQNADGLNGKSGGNTLDSTETNLINNIKYYAQKIDSGQPIGSETTNNYNSDITAYASKSGVDPADATTLLKAKSSGYDFNTAINTLNNYRTKSGLKPYSGIQKNKLEILFNAR